MIYVTQMKINLFFTSLIFTVLSSLGGFAQTNDYPESVKKLMQAYPESLKEYDGSYILLFNGEKVRYNSNGKKEKTHIELMNSENVNDIFYYQYKRGIVHSIPKNYDPGRVRNEELLKKMYGASSSEVQKNLVTIVWCPKLINQKLRVTSINGIDKKLKAISDELDKHPEWEDYLKSSGVFNWRIIKGSTRLSSHSFGTAIDINVAYSNYWQWDCRCTSEDAILKYKNRIPQGIVDIFEKYGFIWGGKWYHYDTMHFEYRPELLLRDSEV